MYDYWLGGKDNFAADRAAGDQAIRAFPDIVLSARSNRAFLARAVRFLAGDAGIRQFLDVGTGIPTGTTPMRWPCLPQRDAHRMPDRDRLSRDHRAGPRAG